MELLLDRALSNLPILCLLTHQQPKRVSVPPLGNLFLRSRNFSISVRDFMSKVKAIPARLFVHSGTYST
jgi:hypothetical protein